MRRRAVISTSLAAAAAATTGLTLAPRAAQAAGRALCFVVNSVDASLSVIDVASRSVTHTVPLLREPHHLVLSPDRKSLVVGDTVGNALFFVDPLTGQLQRRLAAADPYQLQFSPSGRLLTIAGLARAQVDVMDAATYTLIFRVHAPSLPSHIAYSPDSARVFVSLQGSDQLMAIDTALGKAVWSKPVGSTPAGVLWHRGKLLVGLMGEAHVAVVDPASGAVERMIATDEGAHTIFRDHYSETLWVTNRVAGTITQLNPDTLQPVRNVAVPGFPDDLEFSPDGLIWAALRHAHAVGILDPKTGEIAHIKVGRQPHGIWLNTHDRLI